MADTTGRTEKAAARRANRKRRAAAEELGVPATQVDGWDLPHPKELERRKAAQPLRSVPEKGKIADLWTLDYAFRQSGGREGAMNMLRLGASSDERVDKMLELWDKLTEKQRIHPAKLLERLCRDVGLTPGEFVGICTRTAFNHSLDVASQIAAARLPDIVDAGTLRALEPDGVADRKMILEHAQFLPQKGPLVQVTQNNDARSVHLGAGGGLQSFADTSRQVVELLMGASRKELPPAPTAFIEGEILPAEAPNLNVQPQSNPTEDTSS